MHNPLTNEPAKAGFFVPRLNANENHFQKIRLEKGQWNWAHGIKPSRINQLELTD